MLLTSAPLGADAGIEDSWLGVPMYFGGIGQNATRDALHAAGLVVETWEVVPEQEGDRVVNFLWLVARKSVSTG